MIKTLVINNIALIEHLEIDLHKKLNILSGETGAGKSIILNSLAAVLGDKISPDVVRTGAEKAYVEAVFDISRYDKLPPAFEKYEIDINEGELIIRREITTDGKTKCKINAQTLLLNQVKEIAEFFVDIHSQHEHQSLLKIENHLTLLDRFANLENNVEEFAQLHSCLNEKYKERDKLKKLEKERDRILELSKHAADEIDALELKPDEDAELEAEIKKINSAQKIAELSKQAYGDIYRNDKSAIHSLENAIKSVSSITEIDPELENVYKEMEEALFKLENVKELLSDYQDTLEYSQAKADSLTSRLQKIRDLERKYSCADVEELLNFSENKKQEIEEINKSVEKMKALNEKISVQEQRVSSAAVDLSKNRQKASRELSSLIENELKDLGIDKGRFAIDFKYVGDKNSFIKIGDKKVKVTDIGIDRVEFMISTNAGEELRPLKKVASGGELSRVMLAVKSILARLDNVSTLIFDEIDTGIGGGTAFNVGKKLKTISNDKQVLCITHLAQIASMGDANYKVHKFEENNRTKTSIKELTGEDMINEIARMIGGDSLGDKSVEYAKEMIAKANNETLF